MKITKIIILVLFTNVLWSEALNAAEDVTGWELSNVPIVVRGGTLIDVRTGNLTRNTNIVIRGDNIESISSGRQSTPKGAVIIDASNKYIIPGLIDLHVHYKNWSGPLYINHGVTTAVSLGDTYDWIRAQKEGIKRGIITGPRLFYSTENLDQTPEDLSNYYVRQHVRLFDDAEEAQEGMSGYVREGVDAVKVYDGLSKAQLFAIVEEAKKGDIPVIGHFRDVNIAAEVGANGIEHTVAIANAIVDKKARSEAMKKVRKNFNVPTESFMDMDRIPEIVKMMIDNGLYLNPTIRMGWQPDPDLRNRGFHVEDFDLTFNNWDLRFIPIEWRLANLKEYQEIGLWNWRDLSQYERDLFHQGYLNVQKLVKEFSDAGGKLYAGTDSANMTTPGLSLHQEMELLVAAGVSPLISLQAATINPAELMRMEERLGALEVGKVGDLVILEANPLDDIRNTRKISKVISRGKVLDGKYDPQYRNPIPKTTPFQSSHFFPSPRIKTVSPGKIDLGSAEVIITLNGTGFIPYSSVLWNGKYLETEFINQYELRAKVPGKLLSDIGTYGVTVENPDFASGSIYAKGGSDITHLGSMKDLFDQVSNEIKLIVSW